MNVSRPVIPRETKRNVRRRCGYGCVICGNPIYEYDHIQPWSETKAHLFENLTLLCPTHHAEKTKGLLTPEVVKIANANPVNKQKGHSAPYKLQFQGQECVIQVGDSQRFVASSKRTGRLMAPVVVDGKAPLGFIFEEKALLFNLYAENEHQQPVLTVKQGELIIADSVWDAELVGRRLKIRSGPGNLFLDLEFSPPNLIVIRRYTVIINGVTIEFSETELKLSSARTSNVILSGTGMVNAAIGVNVGENRLGLPVGIQI